MICILVLIPTTLCEDKSILCCWMDLMLSVQVAGDFSCRYHCVQRFMMAFLSTRSEVPMDKDYPKCSANGSRSLKSRSYSLLKSNQNNTNLHAVMYMQQTVSLNHIQSSKQGINFAQIPTVGNSTTSKSHVNSIMWASSFCARWYLEPRQTKLSKKSAITYTDVG